MSERAFPIVGVENVLVTRALYEALGFSQTYQFPTDGEPQYVTMTRGSSSIGIRATGHNRRPMPDLPPPPPPKAAVPPHLPAPPSRPPKSRPSAGFVTAMVVAGLLVLGAITGAAYIASALYGDGSADDDAGSGGGFRAFSADSEWNKPLPDNAPVAANSDQIIAEIKTYVNGVYPRLVTSEQWAEPIYFTTTYDAMGDVSCLPINVRVPANLAGATGSDNQATVYDRQTGVVYKVRQFTVNQSTTPWTVTVSGGCSLYYLASNGLEGSLPESDEDRNFGHRGYPPAIHGVRYDEVAAGEINHVIKVAMDKTAECHVYPGSGHESSKGGVLTCEGLILRIKPSVDLRARGLTGGALVIATAMQKYGVVIGDTGGMAMEIKLENLTVEGRPESWADFGIASAHMFQGKLTFDDFVVTQPAYHRP